MGHAEAGPPELRGRPMLENCVPSTGRTERLRFSGSAGVMTTACLKEDTTRNTGSPSGAGA